LKIEYVTCIADGLHRVAEEIGKHFSKIDQLISNCKKIFLKKPSRIQIFKEIASIISLSSQPVVTKRET